MVAPTADDVRQHVCYELKWMLRAVVRFEQLTADRRASKRREASVDDDLVALQDSALVHARNLVEFATPSPDTERSEERWRLGDIVGTKRRKVPARLITFLENRVVPLDGLRATEAKWPRDVDGNPIDANSDERLSALARVVLKLLRPKHRTTTLETPEGVAYVELLDRANEYFEQRTPEAFDRLTCTGDPMDASRPPTRARST